MGLHSQQTNKHKTVIHSLTYKSIKLTTITIIRGNVTLQDAKNMQAFLYVLAKGKTNNRFPQ